MEAMAGGATITLPTGGKYTRKTLDQSWEITRERRNILMASFRAVKPRKHEWIPTDLMPEVVDRAGGPKQFLEGATWIHVQDDLRSPNSSVLFVPEGKARRMEFDEDEGRQRVVLQGHKGAGLFFPPDQKKPKEVQEQFGGQEDFHEALRGVFRSATTIGGTLDGVSDIAKVAIWNGTPLDLHPKEVDGSGSPLPSTLPATQAGRYGQIFSQFARTRAKFG
jgi:hypothetical protein